MRWSEKPDEVYLKSFYGTYGIFELKGDDGSIYKTVQFHRNDGEYSWSYKMGWNKGNSSDFWFTYHKNQNIKDLINIFGSNNTLAVRCDRFDFVKRFETAMFWEVLAAQGITKEELFKAIDNEKF